MVNKRGTPLNTLGARIRFERQFRGLTQRELAAASQMAVEDLAGIESGQRPATAPEQARIATALGLTLESISGVASRTSTRRGVG